MKHNKSKTHHRALLLFPNCRFVTCACLARCIDLRSRIARLESLEFPEQVAPAIQDRFLLPQDNRVHWCRFVPFDGHFNDHGTQLRRDGYSAEHGFEIRHAFTQCGTRQKIPSFHLPDSVILDVQRNQMWLHRDDRRLGLFQ
jgi:hypothetical protein